METAPGVTSFRDLTTFRVGGPIRRVVYVTTTSELVSLVQTYDGAGEHFLILGGGSNVLASDDPFEGTVIVVQSSEIDVNESGADVLITADAGVVWDTLVAMSVERGWWGFENLSGIPGSVGAAPIQNIGAYGAELSESVVEVTVYDRHEKKIRTLSREQCAFGYRTSIFKEKRERYVVLSVRFMLSTVSKPRLAYKDLAHFFERKSTPSLQDVRDAVLSIRAKKFPDLRTYGTAGSFFMNPLISHEVATRLHAEYPELPHFSQQGVVKISLAWVLDHIIHAKGMRVGGAFVWDAQPLVIATEAGARASDVRTLAEKISALVFEKIFIRITPEVNFL